MPDDFNPPSHLEFYSRANSVKRSFQQLNIDQDTQHPSLRVSPDGQADHERSNVIEEDNDRERHKRARSEGDSSPSMEIDSPQPSGSSTDSSDPASGSSTRSVSSTGSSSIIVVNGFNDSMSYNSSAESPFGTYPTSRMDEGNGPLISLSPVRVSTDSMSTDLTESTSTSTTSAGEPSAVYPHHRSFQLSGRPPLSTVDSADSMSTDMTESISTSSSGALSAVYPHRRSFQLSNTPPLSTTDSADSREARLNALRRLVRTDSSPSTNTFSSPAVPATDGELGTRTGRTSSTHDQYRSSIDRFNAFDSHISALRRSPLPPPPSTHPLSVASRTPSQFARDEATSRALSPPAVHRPFFDSPGAPSFPRPRVEESVTPQATATARPFTTLRSPSPAQHGDAGPSIERNRRRRPVSFLDDPCPGMGRPFELSPADFDYTELHRPPTPPRPRPSRLQLPPLHELGAPAPVLAPPPVPTPPAPAPAPATARGPAASPFAQAMSDATSRIHPEARRETASDLFSGRSNTRSARESADRRDRPSAFARALGRRNQQNGTDSIESPTSSNHGGSRPPRAWLDLPDEGDFLYRDNDSSFPLWGAEGRPRNAYVPPWMRESRSPVTFDWGHPSDINRNRPPDIGTQFPRASDLPPPVVGRRSSDDRIPFFGVARDTDTRRELRSSLYEPPAYADGLISGDRRQDPLHQRSRHVPIPPSDFFPVVYPFRPSPTSPVHSPVLPEDEPSSPSTRSRRPADSNQQDLERSRTTLMTRLNRIRDELSRGLHRRAASDVDARRPADRRLPPVPGVDTARETGDRGQTTTQPPRPPLSRSRQLWLDTDPPFRSFLDTIPPFDLREEYRWYAPTPPLFSSPPPAPPRTEQTTSQENGSGQRSQEPPSRATAVPTVTRPASSIDVNSFHEGPFRASLQRFVEHNGENRREALSLASPAPAERRVGDRLSDRVLPLERREAYNSGDANRPATHLPRDDDIRRPLLEERRYMRSQFRRRTSRLVDYEQRMMEQSLEHAEQSLDNAEESMNNAMNVLRSDGLQNRNQRGLMQLDGEAREPERPGPLLRDRVEPNTRSSPRYSLRFAARRANAGTTTDNAPPLHGPQIGASDGASARGIAERRIGEGLRPPRFGTEVVNNHFVDLFTVRYGPHAGPRMGRRPGRNFGDYIRDEDFDGSYDSLLSLAAHLGDARPRSTPEHVIAGLPTAFYKDWAQEGSDTRCPICLDDYKYLDSVLKLPDCSHWLHKQCLEQWLRTARTCPVCRARVGASNGPHTHQQDNHRRGAGGSDFFPNTRDPSSFVRRSPSPDPFHDWADDSSDEFPPSDLMRPPWRRH